MSNDQSNVGSGMVPCRKTCRCVDCRIEAKDAEIERQKQLNMNMIEEHCQAELRYEERIEKLELSEELAWGIIANAYGGDWNLASGDWVDAATRWRDKYLDAIAEVN